MGRVFLFGAYKYPRELSWLIGVVILVLAMLEGFTRATSSRGTGAAYWATVVGINLNATAPVAGPFLADFLRGGTEIGNDTLARFYSLHMLLLPGGLIALIGLHLYLVVRLGIHAAALVEGGGRLRAGRERAPLARGPRRATASRERRLADREEPDVTSLEDREQFKRYKEDVDRRSRASSRGRCSTTRS